MADTNDQVEYVICEAHPTEAFPHCNAPGILIREPKRDEDDSDD